MKAVLKMFLVFVKSKVVLSKYSRIIDHASRMRLPESGSKSVMYQKSKGIIVSILVINFVYKEFDQKYGKYPRLSFSNTWRLK